MDDLLNDINVLVGICLLPKPDDSTDDVSNESSEDEDSDEIITEFCAIRTCYYPLITSGWTRYSYLIVSLQLNVCFQFFLRLVYNFHHIRNL